MGYNIVLNDAGWGTFGWLIAVFLLVTSYALNTYKTKGTYRLAGKYLDEILRKQSYPFTCNLSYQPSQSPTPVRYLEPAPLPPPSSEIQTPVSTLSWEPTTFHVLGDP
jgi:hypothetical protein